MQACLTPKRNCIEFCAVEHRSATEVDTKLGFGVLMQIVKLGVWLKQFLINVQSSCKLKIYQSWGVNTDFQDFFFFWHLHFFVGNVP